MREIKFRRSHFDENNNFMYFTYWGFLNHKDEFDCKCFKSPSNSNKSKSHKDEQYTGLKDKNDVEIYEGDIVIVEDKPYNKSKNEVKWGIKSNSWKLYQLEGNQYKYYSLGNSNKTEVIGNIHEK